MCAEIVSVVNQVFRYALDSLSMSTATEIDEVKPQFKQNYNSFLLSSLFRPTLRSLPTDNPGKRNAIFNIFRALKNLNANSVKELSQQ